VFNWVEAAELYMQCKDSKNAIKEYAEEVFSPVAPTPLLPLGGNITKEPSASK